MTLTEEKHREEPQKLGEMRRAKGRSVKAKIGSGLLALASSLEEEREEGSDQITAENSKENKKSSKKNMEKKPSSAGRIAAGLLFLYILSTGSGKNFLNDLLESFMVEKDISMYNCEKVSNMFDGQELQNAFGGKFAIVDISNLRQLRKNKSEIVCRALVTLGNGRERLMRLSIRKEEGGKIFMEAKPL